MLNLRIFIDDIEFEVRTPKRKRGRSASAVWDWLIDDASLLNAKSAVHAIEDSDKSPYEE